MLDERKEIKKILRDHFDLGQLQSLVRDARRDYEALVRQNGTKLDAIMDIVDDAERTGWTMSLLEAIEGDVDWRIEEPLKGTILAVVRALQAQIKTRLGQGTALEDPFQTCFIRGGWPYVNRPEVRDAYVSLTQPAGLRIAVINGPSGSGKTYSKELPLFVAAIVSEERRFKVSYHDLGEGSYAVTAERLALSILRAWGLTLDIPAQLSLSSSYATELSEWLAAQVPKDETWWIIVDGLLKITPDPGLVSFVMALASHIADSPHALRLVLLDLGPQHVLPMAAEFLSASIEIAPLTADDILDHFFRVLHAACTPTGAFDPGAVRPRAQGVIDRIAAGLAPTELKKILLQETRSLGLC